MKKVVTIAVYQSGATKNQSLFDRLEMIFPDDGETKSQFAARCAKTAKGKYLIFAEREFSFADAHNFTAVLEEANADIVTFKGGAALKLTAFKSVNFALCEDEFCATVLTCLNAKSLINAKIAPITYKNDMPIPEGNLIAEICEEFQKIKAKLNKEVYAYTFDLISDALVKFYIKAILAVRNGELEREKFVCFDNKLKTMIVLYLAVEKKFPVSKLQKLREKDFKISFLTANKLKKFI